MGYLRSLLSSLRSSLHLNIPKHTVSSEWLGLLYG